MAFFLGAFARDAASSLPPDCFAEISAALGTSAWESFQFRQSPRLVLGWRSIDGSARLLGEDEINQGVICGHAYGDGETEFDASSLVVERLLNGKDDFGFLSGDFSLAYFDAAQDCLHLMTDKLGVRPLFVHANESVVYFSSSLTLMERLSKVPKVMNLRATTELSFFGWPIGDRTPYRDIKVLRPGERMRFQGKKSESVYYWRWNTLPAWSGTREEFTQAMANAFRKSMSRRRAGDSQVFSFLSGGLDSRMIAVALKEQGCLVHSVNFSPPGTQDQVFGERFAQAAGLVHFQRSLVPGRAPNHAQQLSESYRRGEVAAEVPLERPHWVCAGTGGSTGFGMVFFDEKLIGHFREGRLREALDLFFSRLSWKLIENLFQPKEAERMKQAVYAGIEEELKLFPCADPARTFHLFLMMNDQRRHLHPHWDLAETHAMQFHAPYFDSHLVELMLAYPIEWGLYHGLYESWMAEFDPVARSTPWQTYPGHRPCPLPVTETFPTQWESNGKYVLKDKRLLSKVLRDILKSKPFPEFFNVKYLNYVRMRRLMGSDYNYAVEAARKHYDYFVKSHGQFDWV